MTTWTTDALRRIPAAAVLGLAMFAACDLSEPLSPREPQIQPRLSVVEVTISGIGSGNITSSVISAPDFRTLERIRAQRQSMMSSVLDPVSNADLSGDGTIQLEPLSTGSFTMGARGADGVRYIQASFRVRNAPAAGGAGYDVPRENLTFMAVDTDNTHGETAISQLGTFGGTAITGATAVALAESMLPTGAAARTAAGGLATDYADVLQVVTESEVAAIDLSGVPDVSSMFPYGFVTRCVANCTGSSRTLAASPAVDQFDGVVTFGFKVPLQATAAEDPYAISVVFLAMDDSETRITESPEDQLSGSTAIRQAAAALGNPTVTLLGASSTSFPTLDVRRICTVRTAGVDPLNPTATLVDAGAACTTGLSSNVRAVDDDAAPAGDGTSWGTAFNTLQEALECVRNDAACAGVDEIWVAEGVYYTDEGGTAVADDAASVFELVEGVSVYGGFAGSEYSRDQRDWQNRVTVLSGDITQDDANVDGNDVAETVADIVGTNSSVLLAGVGAPITAATVLDGFTITAGHSDGDTGGMRCEGTGGECSPTLRNLVFSGNSGTGTGTYTTGGLSILALGSGTASPRVENVVFTGNSGVDAGGVFIQATTGATASPVFVNGTFSANTGAVEAIRIQAGAGATSQPFFHGLDVRNHDGGTTGIYTVYSTGAAPYIASSVFYGNTTLAGGAMMTFQGGTPVVINSTIAGNGSVLMSSGTSAALHNMVMWGNGVTPFSNAGAASTVTITYSIIEGGCPAVAGYGCSAIASVNPQFVDLAGGDLRPGASSPAVDQGNNSLLPADTHDIDGDGNTAELLPLDILGNARIADWGNDDAIDLVDLGAYERQ